MKMLTMRKMVTSEYFLTHIELISLPYCFCFLFEFMYMLYFLRLCFLILYLISEISSIKKSDFVAVL